MKLTLYSLWLICSSMADILIAASLVVTLSRASASITTRSTKALLSRLIFVAIQSGTITTVIVVLALTTYTLNPTSNDSAYFSFCLGRAYTLTMLFNLNLRRSLGDRCRACGVKVLEGTSVYTGDIITGGKLETRPRRDSDDLETADTETDIDSNTTGGTDQPCGIHVHLAKEIQFGEKESAPSTDSRVSGACLFSYPPSHF